MIKRVLSLVLMSAFLLDPAKACLFAQEEAAPPQEQAQAPAQETAPEKAVVKPAASTPEDEKVVLSPWRVGNAKTEERKRELEKRRQRVLRKAKKEKRNIERRKKEARERAARKKEQPDSFFPTNF
ncbi:MAG: hypothetical protein ACM3L6_03540 [Deltaproteobacteria bacterium]